MKSLTEDPDAELLIDAMPSNRSRRIAGLLRVKDLRTDSSGSAETLSSDCATRSRSQPSPSGYHRHNSAEDEPPPPDRPQRRPVRRDHVALALTVLVELAEGSLGCEDSHQRVDDRARGAWKSTMWLVPRSRAGPARPVRAATCPVPACGPEDPGQPLGPGEDLAGYSLSSSRTASRSTTSGVVVLPGPLPRQAALPRTSRGPGRSTPPCSSPPPWLTAAARSRPSIRVARARPWCAHRDAP